MITTAHSEGNTSVATILPKVTAPIQENIAIPANTKTNSEQIKKDLSLMLQYASARGITIPTDVVLSGGDTDVSLVASYNSMIKTIAPATVQSICYIRSQILAKQEKHKRWAQTPIITKCLIIACLALICLIVTSLSPDVNNQNQSAGLLSADGLILFYNLAFICSASLLGVMFYLLKTLSDKIKNYSLLPIDAIDVNSNIIIGIISGFILAELFTFSSSTLGGSIETQKMTLALLGGFSADAIFSILKGIVNKAKTLFSSASEG